jgi:hypothetical protein
MGGDIFNCTDWYKKSIIFLCGQKIKVKICTELQYEMQESGQDTKWRGGQDKNMVECVNLL